MTRYLRDTILDGFERGREPSTQALELQDSAPELDATLDFLLRPTRPITVTVQGQVTDASNGAPIQGTLITVREGLSFAGRFSPTDSTYTDSTGTYAIATADFCGISGTSCFVSVSVRAQTGDHAIEVQGYDSVNVFGDSLVLLGNFQMRSPSCLLDFNVLIVGPDDWK